MKHERPTLPHLIILFTVVLASCRTGLSVAEIPSDEPLLAPTTNPASATKRETGASGSEATTIVDALGREVTFLSPPRRIVIAGRATSLVTDALYLFPEAEDRLVSFENRTQRGLSFFPLVDSHLKDKNLLERNAGPEQIAPFQPDVVVLKSFMAESLGDALEQIGIPVLYVELETPEQFDRDLLILGKMLGNEARSQEILDFYTSQLQRLDQNLESVEEDDKPDVLVVQYSDKGDDVAFMVPSASWLQTTLVHRAGGKPVWAEAAQKGGWTVVGFEQIAAWNPDQVFVIYYPDDPTPIVERLKEEPNWRELKAVQEGEIYAFAGDFMSWDQPDPRWILGLTWLATRIHPETTSDIDLTAEITAFYHQMYGLEPETIEAEILPLVQAELD